MASQWFFCNGDERQGPVSSEQLRALARSGVITPDTLVWKEGFPDWRPASEIPRLIDGPSPPEEPSPKVPAEGSSLTGLSSVAPPSSSPGRSLRDTDSPQLPLADRILRAGFAIGRWFSIVIVLLALITILIAGFVFSTSFISHAAPELGEPERPEWSDYINDCIGSGRGTRGRLANGWTVRADAPGPAELQGDLSGGRGTGGSCGAYVVRLRDALASLKISNQDGQPEDQLCEVTRQFPEEVREWFVDGLLSFAQQWANSEGRRGSCDASEAVVWFVGAAERELIEVQARYDQELAEHRRSEAGRIFRQVTSLQVLGYAVAGLLVFLVFPLLIQIERNTRP